MRSRLPSFQFKPIIIKFLEHAENQIEHLLLFAFFIYHHQIYIQIRYGFLPDNTIPDAMPMPPTETIDRTADKKRRYTCHPPPSSPAVVPRRCFCVHATPGSHSRPPRLLLTTGTARPNAGTACLQSMRNKHGCASRPRRGASRSCVAERAAAASRCRSCPLSTRASSSTAAASTATAAVAAASSESIALKTAVVTTPGTAWRAVLGVIS